MSWLEDIHIGLAIKRVHVAERVAIDNALRDKRLTASQWGILRLLVKHGSLSNAELARLGVCAPQSMWEMVQHLEREGWVERAHHPSHGTVMPIQITPAGRRVLDEANQLVFTIEEQMLKGVTLEEGSQLHDLLQRCLTNLNDGCAEAKESGVPIVRASG
jgi:DNA-binding MarR family transcriptional regulator